LEDKPDIFGQYKHGMTIIHNDLITIISKKVKICTTDIDMLIIQGTFIEYIDHKYDDTYIFCKLNDINSDDYIIVGFNKIFPGYSKEYRDLVFQSLDEIWNKYLKTKLNYKADIDIKKESGLADLEMIQSIHYLMKMTVENEMKEEQIFKIYYPLRMIGKYLQEIEKI
jgi:hypothetical protein